MFNEAVITMDGLELDAKIRAGHTVATFTHVKLGDGTYDGTEDLSIATNMKSIKQSFGISSILVTDNKTVRLRTVSDNTGINEGYLISEIGIFAQDPDKGEILYSIALGVDGKMDYQPSESELPGATSTFDTYVSVSNVEAATILTDCGAAASAEDLEEIKCPEFDDSGEVTGITNFPAFLEKIKSKMNIFEFFKNLKAGLKFVLHTGQIVNNCVSDNPGLPLSAAQGKVLMDLINQTNGNLSQYYSLSGGTSIPAGADLKSDTYKIPGNYYCMLTGTARTLINCPCDFAFILKVEYGNGVSYPIQTFISLDSKNETIKRMFDDGNRIWTPDTYYITNSDLKFYNTTNGITKIASLPWGIYNLQDSEVRTLTDKPSELNQGRSIIITSGLSTNDEKIALILASSGGDGGVYFGYVWGSAMPEFSWKKIIGNNS